MMGFDMHFKEERDLQMKTSAKRCLEASLAAIFLAIATFMFGVIYGLEITSTNGVISLPLGGALLVTIGGIVMVGATAIEGGKKRPKT